MSAVRIGAYYILLIAFVAWVIGPLVGHPILLQIVWSYGLTPPLVVFLLDAAYVYFQDRNFARSSLARLLRFNVTREADVYFWLLYFGLPVSFYLQRFPFPEVARALGGWIGAGAFSFWAAYPIGAFVLAFLALSAADFLAHWLCHRIPFLWEMHKIHHAASEMNVLTTYREHLFINVFKNALPPVLLSAVGLSPYVLGGAYLSRRILEAFQHSQADVKLGWLGKVIMSPHAHRMHHLGDERYFNRNFGFDLTLWDRLLGSYQESCEWSSGEMDQRFGIQYAARDRFILVEMWLTLKSGIWP